MKIATNERDLQFIKTAKVILRKTRKQLETFNLLQGDLLIVNYKTKVAFIASALFCHNYRLMKQMYETCFHGFADCGQIICRGILDTFVNMLLVIRSEEEAEKFFAFSLMSDETLIHLVRKMTRQNDKDHKLDEREQQILDSAAHLRKKYGYTPNKRLIDWYGNKPWKDKYDEVGLSNFYDIPNYLFSATAHANPKAVLGRFRGQTKEKNAIFQIDGQTELAGMVAAEGSKLFILTLVIFSFSIGKPKLIEPFAPEIRRQVVNHPDFKECFEKNVMLKEWIEKI